MKAALAWNPKDATITVSHKGQTSHYEVIDPATDQMRDKAQIAKDVYLLAYYKGMGFSRESVADWILEIFPEEVTP